MKSPSHFFSAFHLVVRCELVDGGSSTLYGRLPSATLIVPHNGLQSGRIQVFLFLFENLIIVLCFEFDSLGLGQFLPHWHCSLAV